MIGQWETINDGLNCAELGSPGSCPSDRHETGYVEVGDKFYLLGGRETNKVNIYDPATDIWTEGAASPINIHHYQGVEYQGFIYVMGAFTGTFPNDIPVSNIYIYDPVMDEWIVGPEIPVARRRGGAGCVVYKGKIYLSGGIVNGHVDGVVNWLDEYDPVTNTWTILPDAPNTRDHCKGAIYEDKLYMVGGAKTGFNGNINSSESAVDVYDFDTQTWTTLNKPIPTPRGGHAIAVLGNELLAIGGNNNTGIAITSTEALNLDNGNWRTLPNLNQARHGYQAVVNNGVVYVAAGAPLVSGSDHNSQEVFYFTQKNVPVLNPIAQSLLEVEGENLNTLNFLEFVDHTETIKLRNTQGNQGIIIEDINIVLGSSPTFSIATANNVSFPLVLAAGDSLEVIINTTGPVPAEEEGILLITHSGANAQSISIILNDVICIDLDGDGICSDEDCNDNDPLIPTAEGTACDDGNPNTDNDVILSDGCTCQGSGDVIADCNGVLFIGGNEEISIANLFATSEKVEIIGAGTGYDLVVICDDDCGNMETIPNLTPGSYNVKLNMFGSDDSYCYREETVTVSPGPCIDVDEDGICADEDCDDTDPTFPMLVGTACDDGDTTTINDVILSDGCTCQGVVTCSTDVDADGVCSDEDCDDTNPNVPTIPGTACDDGDETTVGDVILVDGCTCAGSNSGPANCDDIEFIGEGGQLTISNLAAASELVEVIGLPTNWQIVPVCNGDCEPTQVVPNLAPGIYTVKISMFGDDNSYCYREEEVIVVDGPCIDADEDGVCFNEDCDDTDPTFPMPQGTPCDDGDPDTTGDVILADGCTCAGTFVCLIDVDNDGVCAVDDCDDTDPAFPLPQGTPCDDGDSLTANDMIQADGCSCMGVLCIDGDSDGICLEDDCDDTDPAFPMPQGTPCDDGDPDTTDDVYLADGCTCAGTAGGPANCDNVQFIGGNGIISLTNLTSAKEEISIIGSNTNWAPVLICAEADACANPFIITNLSPGFYTIKLQMFGDDNSYCYRQEDVLVFDGPCTDEDNDGVCVELDCDDTDPNLPTVAGTSCDDEDADTTEDVIQADGCTCEGVLSCLVDNDGDGVCADIDCDDTNPNLPTLAGTSCDDGNPDTSGDVIQTDGCTCEGSMGGSADCDNVEFIGGAGEITLTNLTALWEQVEIIGAGINWQVIEICNRDCEHIVTIPNLPPGTYMVKLQMFGDDNSYCFRQEDVEVTALAANRANKVLAFTAYPVRQVVEMEWLNNTGYRNDRFVIERSADGVNFETILEYDATGNTDATNKYKELDANPLQGENYYRLKLIYDDASFEYTPIQRVIFADVPDFGLFPNPAQDVVFMDLKRFLGKEVVISIQDQLGRTRYEQEVDDLSIPMHQIELADFDNGLYIIQVKTDGYRLIAKKLLVSKLH